VVDKLQSGPWVLRSGTGTTIATHESPNDFVDALRRAMSEASDIELLYEVWERNLEAVRAVHRISNDGAGVVPALVAHLRACAVALVKGASNGGSHPAPEETLGNADEIRGVPHKIDKSVLTFGEPKRIRCKEHLRFVGSQPCLICGRSPSHAHHVRYAQSRGLSLKGSDEFTVPLCAIHHNHIHTTGKEREWWQERNIDPLKVASELWQRSRERDPAANEAALSESADIPSDQPGESDNLTTQLDTATAIIPKPIDAAAARKI
jgi:hypothetical protein